MSVRSSLSKIKCLHNLNVLFCFLTFVNGITIFQVTNTWKWTFDLWQCDRKRRMVVSLSHRYLKLKVSQHKFIFLYHIVVFSFLLPLSGTFHSCNIELEISFCDACIFANNTAVSNYLSISLTPESFYSSFPIR